MYPASDIAGWDVGKNWIDKFCDCHVELLTSKTWKLDPKWTNNFNQSTYNDFANKYPALHEKYGGIPSEHIWNMDEKVIQMGGSCKKGGKVQVFFKRSG